MSETRPADFQTLLPDRPNSLLKAFRSIQYKDGLSLASKSLLGDWLEKEIPHGQKAVPARRKSAIGNVNRDLNRGMADHQSRQHRSLTPIHSFVFIPTVQNPAYIYRANPSPQIRVVLKRREGRKPVDGSPCLHQKLMKFASRRGTLGRAKSTGRKEVVVCSNRNHLSFLNLKSNLSSPFFPIPKNSASASLKEKSVLPQKSHQKMTPIHPSSPSLSSPICSKPKTEDYSTEMKTVDRKEPEKRSIFRKFANPKPDQIDHSANREKGNVSVCSWKSDDSLKQIYEAYIY